MKPTILAVDDDPIILDMFQAVLDQGHHLHLVSSGQEALDFLNSHPRVDLILLDIMMPGIDGYETCQRIRENPLYSQVKVILVSSKVKLEERLSGYQVGADDYITKPFEASELVAKINVYLRLKNAEEIDRIKNNFIKLMNHETRTPLTGIFGYAALLQQSPNLSDQEKQFVDEIQKCAAALLRSSENTRLLSDLKSGNIQIEKTKIPLSDFLAGCQHKFKTAADDKRLLFQTHTDDALWIDGDARLLEVAVDALLDNAVKFAREATVVHVTAKAMEDRIQVEVTLRDSV
jgi:DNA-binding response OmpR family regulator